MGLHNLKPAEGSRKTRKRKARGPASGWGKTAGRGQNGQKSRSGGLPPVGFEGGQMPLQRRVPKRGFKNIFAKNIASVNLRDLNRFDDGTEITPEVLQSAGLVRKNVDGVKILGGGELERKLSVTAHRFSKSAEDKIEAAGGTVTKL